MWFAKWFGGRSSQERKRARIAPVVSRPVVPAQRARDNVAAKADSASRQVKRGFDPYNSGSFDRNQAWERVLR